MKNNKKRRRMIMKKNYQDINRRARELLTKSEFLKIEALQLLKKLHCLTKNVLTADILILEIKIRLKNCKENLKPYQQN